ncbi:hypothetical protein ACSQ67_003429 [Phaseolus vulgaris]
MNQRVSHEQKVLDPVRGDDHRATKRSPRDAVALPLQPDATTPPKGAGTTASTNEPPRLGSILILDAEPCRGQPRRRPQALPATRDGRMTKENMRATVACDSAPTTTPIMSLCTWC